MVNVVSLFLQLHFICNTCNGDDSGGDNSSGDGSNGDENCSDDGSKKINKHKQQKLMTTTFINHILIPSFPSLHALVPPPSPSRSLPQHAPPGAGVGRRRGEEARALYMNG